MTPNQFKTQWTTESDTQRFAAALATSPLIRNAQIHLRGDLGAGKTTFVRHLLAALGVKGRVKSPTYAIVEPHAGVFLGEALAISHFDFYRFDDPQEWEEAGFRDTFAERGLKLVEWPQRVATLLTSPDLDLQLVWSPGESDVRQATVTALTPTGDGLLAAIEAAQ